jgi:hypothetical protein
MSASSRIQLGLQAMLSAAGALRADVPVVARREKERTVEIQMAAAIQGGLAIAVLPPLPRSADSMARVVFFEDAEIRVRIIETPNKNVFGVSAYDLVDDIMRALHNRVIDGFGQPLLFGRRLTERVEDAQMRIIDVLFSMAYQLYGEPIAPVAYTPAAGNASADLQGAMTAQLAGPLAALGVPLLSARDKDQASRIDQAGHPLAVKVQPPLPVQTRPGMRNLLIERAELRVKITEIPALNLLEVDAYDVIETVARALHGREFPGLTQDRIRIAETPTELHEDPRERQIDVVFRAAYGLGRTPTADSAIFTADETNLTADSGADAATAPTADSATFTADNTNLTADQTTP